MFVYIECVCLLCEVVGTDSTPHFGRFVVWDPDRRVIRNTHETDKNENALRIREVPNVLGHASPLLSTALGQFGRTDFL